MEQAQRPQGWRVVEQPVDPLALAEERLWWAEVCTAVAEAIARLPGRQREVMLAVCGRDGQPPWDLTQIGRQSPGRGLW